MDPDFGDRANCDILIGSGRILAVGEDIGAPGAARIDASGMIVIPGLVDTHRHMWQAVLRGSGVDHTLPEYFREVLGRLGRRLTPEDLYLGNLLSGLGALDAGVTTVQDTSNVNDAPSRTDALVQGLRDAGLRAVFAYGHGAGDVPARPPNGGLSTDVRRVRDELLPGDRDLVTMALCVEASTDEAVRWNWGLAAELNVPVTLHCRGSRGVRPVSRLLELGVLRAGAVFIHGTGLDAAELRLIADHGCMLSVAPAVEMIMGHGYPPVLDAIDAGLWPSLSVDVETATGADLFTQMRAAQQVARHARQHHRSSGPLLSARQILECATVHGARALGMEDRIGSLRPGKQADLVLLRTDRPGVAPVWDPVAAVVSSVDRGDVDTVLVAGRILKRHGRLRHERLPDVLARAAAARDRLVGPA